MCFTTIKTLHVFIFYKLWVIWIRIFWSAGSAFRKPVGSRSANNECGSTAMIHPFFTQSIPTYLFPIFHPFLPLFLSRYIIYLYLWQSLTISVRQRASYNLYLIMLPRNSILSQLQTLISPWPNISMRGEKPKNNSFLEFILWHVKTV